MQTREIPGALVLTVTGEIDMLTAPHLHTAVSAAMQQGEKLLVLDLSEVSFLGSPGLAVLVAANQAATRSSRAAIRLVVAENRAVIRPLRVTALDRVLATYGSLDEALD